MSMKKCFFVFVLAIFAFSCNSFAQSTGGTTRLSPYARHFQRYLEQLGHRVCAKDTLFILIGCVLILRTGFLGRVIGALAIIWYGRDFYYRVKALGSAIPRERDDVNRPAEPARDNDAPIIDDGKIQVMDLSGAKEVDFEKE